MSHISLFSAKCFDILWYLIFYSKKTKIQTNTHFIFSNLPCSNETDEAIYFQFRKSIIKLKVVVCFFLSLSFPNTFCDSKIFFFWIWKRTILVSIKCCFFRRIFFFKSKSELWIRNKFILNWQSVYGKQCAFLCVAGRVTFEFNLHSERTYKRFLARVVLPAIPSVYNFYPLAHLRIGSAIYINIHFEAEKQAETSLKCNLVCAFSECVQILCSSIHIQWLWVRLCVNTEFLFVVRKAPPNKVDLCVFKNIIRYFIICMGAWMIPYYDKF